MPTSMGEYVCELEEALDRCRQLLKSEKELSTRLRNKLNIYEQEKTTVSCRDYSREPKPEWFTCTCAERVHYWKRTIRV